MSRVVVFSLCLILTIKSIDCIECYSCISSENPDCVNPENSMEKKECDSDGLRKTSDYAINLNADFRKIFEVEITEHPIPLSCLKLDVKVEGKEVILRGCQLPKDSQNHLDVCKKVFETQNKNNMQVSHCSLCETDGCNHSSPIGVPKMCILAMVLINAVNAFKAF